MRIDRMTATFGKLNNASLELQPGLNLIYAPNESGKSTWCAFLRTMLYGLPTRDRGMLADKNRYAPWSGAAMRGRMDVTAQGQHYTVIRDTLRAASPMGEFSCTFSGTAESVPHLTAQDLGEQLLGISREVFTRSAFIGQSGLAVDQDTDLERRISALVTSGEEDVSFSEVYERLKKQRNRRKHNKTGLIPELESEIAQLQDSLLQLQTLHSQEGLLREQLQQHQRQVADLETRLAQWEALHKQDALRQYLQAQRQAAAAAQEAEKLAKQTPHLPDAAELGRLEGMATALDQTLATTEAAGEQAAHRQQLAIETRERYHQHPLYPADESQLAAQRSASTAPTKPFSPLFALLFTVLSGGIGALLWLWQKSIPLAAGCGIGLLAAALLIYNSIRRRKNRIAAESAQRQQAAFDEAVADYLHLQQLADDARSEAERAAVAAHSLHRSCREGLLQLLGRVQPFAPETTNLTNVFAALKTAVQQRTAIDEACRAARDLQLHCQMLHRHLPDGPLPDADAALPRPTTGYEQLREALPRAMAGAQEAQSRLDTVRGQLQAMGDRDALESRLAAKQGELEKLQGEYDALTAAMDALQSADQTLQNRFSPALGQRAAEIFSHLTGGRYEKVLFRRDFTLSAETAGDPIARDLRLLSQGTADQLYLAVRLAICDMVLPAENAVPVILDDALANFDEPRMAAALDWLVEEGKHRQILLFTCQKREGEYLKHRTDVAQLSL